MILLLILVLSHLIINRLFSSKTWTIQNRKTLIFNKTILGWINTIDKKRISFLCLPHFTHNLLKFSPADILEWTYHTQNSEINLKEIETKRKSHKTFLNKTDSIVHIEKELPWMFSILSANLFVSHFVNYYDNQVTNTASWRTTCCETISWSPLEIWCVTGFTLF